MAHETRFVAEPSKCLRSKDVPRWSLHGECLCRNKGTTTQIHVAGDSQCLRPVRRCSHCAATHV
eukprot:9751133-Lingulodinium_polyedra.AAC.1